MTGVSLWTAANRSDRLAARPVLAGHTGEGPERNVVIEWPYKLIRTAGAERLELYDLVADPGERSDLSESEPDRVVRLQSRLPERQADGRPDPVTLDVETRRSLRELGYLEAPSEAGSPQD
jgi:hypothetical protein